jgi:hypothetical protein
VECDADGGWWVHLRRCTQCGHIGCCDNSPAQHGRKHAAETGHTVITSFEPGEAWFYDFGDDTFYESGPQLAPPESHPVDQPVPGPAGRVPADWRSKMNG